MARQHLTDKRGPRIAELERKLAQAEKTIRAHVGTAEELRKQIGWVRDLTPDHQSIVREFLFQVDATALLSDANQAIRTDKPKITGGGEPPMFDPTPVYAHNFLEGVMDHLHKLTGEVATFNRTTPEVRSTRRSCRQCHQPLGILLERYCTWCGFKLRAGDGEAA